MASITIIQSPFIKNAAPLTEMRVNITGTKSGAAYVFVLRRRHIDVYLLAPTRPTPQQKDMQQVLPKIKKEIRDAKKVEAKKNDWFNALEEEEKTQLFAVISNQYRERSLGDNGFKGASIGVATDQIEMPARPVEKIPVNFQSRLFIGTNTQRWASPYFKHCAEQNMVNAATDTLLYERSLLAKESQKAPTAPKFKAVYVLQATDNKSVPISCPCGKCTDMLAGVMVENGSVITMPAVTEKLAESIAASDQDVVVNTDAVALDNLPILNGALAKRAQAPDDPNSYYAPEKYEVWKTSIETLNKNRELPLNGVQAKAQREGLTVMLKQASSATGLPGIRAKAEYQKLAERLEKAPLEPLPETAMELVPEVIARIQKYSKLATREIRKIVDGVINPSQKAAENIIRHRKSVAQLDCAINTHGFDLEKINNFMVEQITDTIADRMRADPKKNAIGLNEEDLIKWAYENIQSVRCVIIQMDDDTFRYAVQADTTFDNAMPNAEVVALENAAESLGRHGVRRVWAMEMSPRDIKEGKMHTSPKEGLERLFKRASSEGIDLHYVPFNNGNLNHNKVMDIMKSFPTGERAEIYPANYKGAGAGSKTERRASDGAGSWDQFAVRRKVSQQSGESTELALG